MSASLILLLLGIVEPVLASTGVIPTQYQGLATGILAAINAVKAELTNSSGQVTATASSLIAGINAGVQALASVGALGSASGIAVALSEAVAAGEAAESGVTKVDPSALQPVS